ncbi:uncharacterized protein LOC135146122 isoform X4 [Zophobas morio]|uniref:uncharacterized protein LOC135146122 isoform X4 n=1 Tax=Zophobas morio TaxID=2755281 RepID=UPI003082F4CB
MEKSSKATESRTQTPEALEWRTAFIKRLKIRDSNLKKLTFVESSLSEIATASKTNVYIELSKKYFKDRIPFVVLSFYFAIFFITSVVSSNIIYYPLLKVVVECENIVLREGTEYERFSLCHRIENLLINNSKSFLELPLTDYIKNLEIVDAGLQGVTNLSFPSLKELKRLLLIPKESQLSVGINRLRMPKVEKIEFLKVTGLHSSASNPLEFGTLKYNKEMEFINSDLNIVNLSLLQSSNALIFFNSSFKQLIAPLIKMLHTLDLSKVYADGPIRLYLPQLKECETISILNTAGINHLAFPGLKKAGTINIEKTKFLGGTLLLPKLESVAVVRVVDTHNLENIELRNPTKTVRVMVMNTLGLQNFSLKAKSAEYIRLQGNMDLKTIATPRLKSTEVVIKNNNALKSLKIITLESGSVEIKNCKELKEITLPNFMEGTLNVIANSQLSKITAPNYDHNRMTINDCPKLFHFSYLQLKNFNKSTADEHEHLNDMKATNSQAIPFTDSDKTSKPVEYDIPYCTGLPCLPPME